MRMPAARRRPHVLVKLTPVPTIRVYQLREQLATRPYKDTDRHRRPPALQDQALVDALHAIAGVELIRLKTHGVVITKKLEYIWEEVEPEVIATIARKLGWSHQAPLAFVLRFAHTAHQKSQEFYVRARTSVKKLFVSPDVQLFVDITYEEIEDEPRSRVFDLGRSRSG